MAYSTYVARRRLNVNGQWREPGDQVDEARGWSNVRAYVDAGQLEQVAMDGDAPEVEVQPLISEQFDQVLAAQPPQPQAEPPSGGRYKIEDTDVPLACVNCNTLSYLSSEFPEDARWSCWLCHQGQTGIQARAGAGHSETATRQLELQRPAHHGQAGCREDRCIRTLEHSGNHRDEQLKEWAQKPQEPVSSVPNAPMGSHISARTPIDLTAPIPGR